MRIAYLGSFVKIFWIFLGVLSHFSYLILKNLKGRYEYLTAYIF